MEKYFKNVENQYVNVVKHTIEQLEKYPDLKIYIATDSQDDDRTRFATCIVYRYGLRGAHYIFYKEEVPKIPVMYNRLFEEAVRTIAAADMLKKHIPTIQITALEFDYNQIPKYKSNMLVQQIGGWAVGLGYNAVFKGGEMIASKAGDHECRRGERLCIIEEIRKIA